MKLVIEATDVATTGLAVGEYDLDALGAVETINSPLVGSYPEVSIDLVLPRDAKPDSGLARIVARAVVKKVVDRALELHMNPCDECAGSGEWINPANGVGSPCSLGCGS